MSYQQHCHVCALLHISLSAALISIHHQQLRPFKVLLFPPVESSGDPWPCVLVCAVSFACGDQMGAEVSHIGPAFLFSPQCALVSSSFSVSQNKSCFHKAGCDRHSLKQTTHSPATLLYPSSATPTKPQHMHVCSRCPPYAVAAEETEIKFCKHPVC